MRICVFQKLTMSYIFDKVHQLLVLWHTFKHLIELTEQLFIIPLV